MQQNIQIRWYRRLFWKIFLIVWLSSFLAIAMTAFIVGHISERERDQQVLIAKVLGQAERLVDIYERTGRMPPKAGSIRWRDHSHDWDDDRAGRPDNRASGLKDKPEFIPYRMQIYDLQKQQVIFGKPDLSRYRKPLQLALTSDSGNNYRVTVDSDLRSSLAAKLVGFILSVQVVLLLLVAALAGLLISWIIVRPINRLRQHTQDLYNGDLSARTDSKLNNRGDEIGALSREFNRMADYVEQTLQSNQHLLQDVSHELRAPLARLQMAAGLAGQNVSAEDQQYIDRINLECERINRLIDEILSLSRLEQMEVPEQAFDAEPLINNLINDYRFSAPDHPLTLTAESCSVKGNPALLERAMNNIIGNAIKHTPEGTTIAISLNCHSQQCEIIISDNGPGLNQQQLDTLFKPFVRFTEQTEGYGLGLSIAKRAVQILGGNIEAFSQPGAGLTLKIRIPQSQR